VTVGQQKTGRGVIELAVGPYHRVMTILARRREPQRHVIDGRGGVVVIGLVAVHAVPVGDAVVAELRVMATAALQRGYGVAIRQEKPGLGVIKLRRLPRSGVMARLAGRRDSRLLMIGIGSALEIHKVA